jgi:site-specific recombinase XerD
MKPFATVDFNTSNQEAFANLKCLYGFLDILKQKEAELIKHLLLYFYTYLSETYDMSLEQIEMEINRLGHENGEIFLHHLHVLSQFSIISLNKYYLYKKRFREFLDFTSGHLELKKNIKIKKQTRKTTSIIPKVVEDFLCHLRSKNMVDIKQHRVNIMLFCKFLSDELHIQTNNNLSIFSTLSKSDIEKYELTILKRVHLEQISPNRMYKQLYTIQSFSNYCLTQSVPFNYIVPAKYRAKGKRANEYVPKEDTLLLLRGIIEHSNHIARDLCIFLIILETGCRSIEVSNMKIQDLNITERTISLYCKKSGRRNLKVSYELMNHLKHYLEVRPHYIEADDHDALFFWWKDYPIDAEHIQQMYRNINKKVFGNTKRHTSKAFRHKFITDAINGNNGLREIAASVGHKHLVSTFYYYYRNKNELVKRALPFNPFQTLKKEDTKDAN